MKKRTIGILVTSVAVSALCVITDASAIAGYGGGGGGGWHGGGAEAVDFVDLLPTVAWPLWVMVGVAMH